MYVLLIQKKYRDKEGDVSYHDTILQAKKEAENNCDIVSSGLLATILFQEPKGKFQQVVQANYLQTNIPLLDWK